MRLPRTLLLLMLSLGSVACAVSSAEEYDVASEADLGSALSRGEAPVKDAAFVPSSRLEVGTWVAYSVKASARASSEVLFVNHSEDAASVAVSIDPATGRVRVIAAPPDGSGEALVEALLADLVTLEAHVASGAPGAVTTRSFGAVTADVALQLFARAAARLKISAVELLAAVRSYTGSGYRDMNTFLREGAAPMGWTEQAGFSEARTLTNAVRSLPRFEGESRRWFSIRDRGKLTEFLDTLRSGIYRDRAFMSTTRSETPVVGALSTIRFDIRGRTGRDVSKLSAVGPYEQEVLFVPGTRFDVLSVRGEFVNNLNASSALVDELFEFVTVASEYFPGVTRQTLEQRLAARKLPNLVVTLQERGPNPRDIP